MTPEQMKSRLQEAFPGDEVEVVDLTGTEDHYEVSVKSNKFQGLSRIKQHQLVMQSFSAELKTGEVHALSIQTRI